MTRPQVTVTVTAALQRRGVPTDTGVAFIVYAGATGQTTPVECQTTSQIAATAAPTVVQSYISTALAQGAPKVYALRATAVNQATVTEAEWTAALDKLDAGYETGQVLIPGITTAAAHAALLHHAATQGRTVLLDADKASTASAIVTTATALQAAPGANRGTLLAGWPQMPSSSGAVDVPPSVIAAGLVGRGDAAVGHANHAPAGDQGRFAGAVTGALGITPTITDDDHDLLHDAGVSVFRTRARQPQLYGWVSLAVDDAAYRQLNHGRTAMQLERGLRAIAEQFLFRPIDGQGLLYSELEGELRGYLSPMYDAGALFGETPDDAYDVDVRGVNTPETALAGQLNAQVEVKLTSHAERVVINVTINQNGAQA